MLSRRGFLKTALGRSSLVALAPTVPAFLARAGRAAPPDRDGRVLVVVELNGGNDGINTVVPFRDDGYARNRKVLRLPADRLVRVTDDVGLHPSLRDAAGLLEKGRLAIVQGVGYPNPDRSHFRSMEVWHSGRSRADEFTGVGWLGSGLDGDRRAGGEASIYVGSGPPPVALRGSRTAASALEGLEDVGVRPGAGADAWGPVHPRAALPKEESKDDLVGFVHRSMLDAYSTADRLAEMARAREGTARYPATALARRLHAVASLLKLGLGARAFYVVQPGYDTHARQLPAHAELLFELSGALVAFLDDLTAAGLAERVAVLCFSEFGRRVAENASDGGTDHGTAGPVFLAGSGVKGGLAGKAPSLTDLADGDLKVGIDFRRVYAAVLEDWLGLPAKAALGGAFEKLPLFRA